MSIILDSLENTLTTIGLVTPLGRLMGLSAASGVLFYFMKPSIFFMDSGEARPWTFFATPSDQATATVLPYWLASLLIGVVAALFI